MEVFEARRSDYWRSHWVLLKQPCNRYLRHGHILFLCKLFNAENTSTQGSEIRENKQLQRTD